MGYPNEEEYCFKIFNKLGYLQWQFFAFVPADSVDSYSSLFLNYYNTENEWGEDSDEYGTDIRYCTRKEFERVMNNRGKEYQCLIQRTSQTP